MDEYWKLAAKVRATKMAKRGLMDANRKRIAANVYDPVFETRLRRVNARIAGAQAAFDEYQESH